MKISGRQRKGISPIIATVLIIAATLIAFAAVAGYVFGLFGSSTSGANAQSVNTSFVASTGVFNDTFTNSGGKSVTINSISVVVGTKTYSATTVVYHEGGSVETSGINPGVTTYASVGAIGDWTSGGIAATSTTFSSGTTYTFSIILANGITATVQATAT